MCFSTKLEFKKQISLVSLQHFNSRSCQLVLGAGALQVVGLKTITTKNLGTTGCTPSGGAFKASGCLRMNLLLTLINVCVCSVGFPLPAAGGSLHSRHQNSL